MCASPVDLRQKKSPLGESLGGSENKSGSVLLSHSVPAAVPSALWGLTTEFEMGSGVTPTLWPPETLKTEADPVRVSAHPSDG